MSTSDQSRLSYEDTKSQKKVPKYVYRCSMPSEEPYHLPRAKYDRALALLSAPRAKPARQSHASRMSHTARLSASQPRDEPLRRPNGAPPADLCRLKAHGRVMRRCMRPLQRVMLSTNDDAILDSYQHTELNAMLNSISACLTAEDWQRATELICVASKREQTTHSRMALFRLATTLLLHAPAVRETGLLESFVQGVLACRDDQEINFFLYHVGLCPANIAPGDMSAEDARRELKDKRRSSQLAGAPAAERPSSTDDGESEANAHEVATGKQSEQKKEKKKPMGQNGTANETKCVESSGDESIEDEAPKNRTIKVVATNVSSSDDDSSAGDPPLQKIALDRKKNGTRLKTPVKVAATNVSSSDDDSSVDDPPKRKNKSKNVDCRKLETRTNRMDSDDDSSADDAVIVDPLDGGDPPKVSRRPAAMSKNSTTNLDRTKHETPMKTPAKDIVVVPPKRGRPPRPATLAKSPAKSAPANQRKQCIRNSGADDSSENDDMVVVNRKKPSSSVKTLVQAAESTVVSSDDDSVVDDPPERSQPQSPAKISADSLDSKIKPKRVTRRSMSMVSSPEKMVALPTNISPLYPTQCEANPVESQDMFEDPVPAGRVVTRRSTMSANSPDKDATPKRPNTPRKPDGSGSAGPARVVTRRSTMLAQTPDKARNHTPNNPVESESARPARVATRRSTTIEPSPAKRSAKNPAKRKTNSDSNGDDEMSFSGSAAECRQPGRTVARMSTTPRPGPIVTRRSTLLAATPEKASGPAGPATRQLIFASDSNGDGPIETRTPPGRVTTRRSTLLLNGSPAAAASTTKAPDTSTDSGEVDGMVAHRAKRGQPKRVTKATQGTKRKVNPAEDKGDQKAEATGERVKSDAGALSNGVKRRKYGASDESEIVDRFPTSTYTINNY